MNRKPSFTFLSNYLNKFETDIKNYVVPNLYEPHYEHIKPEEGEEKEDTFREIEQFAAFQQCPQVEKPRICSWLYMNKKELEYYIKLKSKRKMREVIDSKILTNPKGCGRKIVVEFMLNVTAFCKNMELHLKQTSVVLSIFYLTHKHFTDHLYICAEEVYDHFKSFLMVHCLLFPPTNINIFSIEESKRILQYFCSLYLRHLPLIRMLTLPNFGFELNYELESEPVKEIMKKGRNKKDTKKKSKKGKGSNKSK